MTKVQKLVAQLISVPIPAFLIGRASVVLMSREGPRPSLLKGLIADARQHWKTDGSELAGHVDACIMRASLALVGRVPSMA